MVYDLLIKYEHNLICDVYFSLFQDLRRNQRRIAELNSTIRKLEDRNTLLVDERNELVKTIGLVKKKKNPTSSLFRHFSSSLLLFFQPPGFSLLQPSFLVPVSI